MILHGRPSSWRLVRISTLAGLSIVATWFASRQLEAESGSSEDVYNRIQIGMGQDETLAVLRSYNPYGVEGQYSSGTTRDGQMFDRTHREDRLFAELPAPHDVASCVLAVCANDGRDLEVTLGPG